MVKPTWLIESGVFGESSDAIKSEIRAQGMAFEVVHARPFLNGIIPTVSGRPLEDDACVIFWGSPPLMHHIRLIRSWRPGGWCNFDRLNCAEYYPHLRQRLINGNCAIDSIDQMLENASELFARYSKNDEVFVRPCTLEKVFTGQLVDIESFQSLLERARYAGCEILVAAPADISYEWRLVVRAGKPIAASQYRVNGEIEIRAGCPSEVISYLDEIWSSLEWIPDEFFVVDVCKSGDNFYVVELNSFSCSGWYACDPAPIVASASESAAKLVAELGYNE